MSRPTAQNPNLLFLYADQHRADVMGCAGNDVVVTPHLDRLAAEGVRFDHAWTESPICQPARASLLTGRFPSDHGVLGNFAGNCQPEWDTFPRRLQQAGYTTATLDDRARALVPSLKERSKTLIHFAEMADFAYQAPAEYDPKAVKKWIKEPALEVVTAIADKLEAAGAFDEATIEGIVNGEAEARELKLGKVAQPIRICLTGRSFSPSLYETIMLVGREQAIDRLRTGVERLGAAR